jgi:hypothetical protein
MNGSEGEGENNYMVERQMLPRQTKRTLVVVVVILLNVGSCEV